MKIKIKENSLLAKLGARKLKTHNVALTLGRTIYLHNASKEDLLQNKRWLRHELKHVEQYLQYGFWGFLLRYTYESIRRGYYNNRLEVAAREAEQDETILERFVI